ncbi:hypothetical protein RZE82_06035 [Mollicutes bacterium LVI A0039]|nr:hypothetical protein RZE82_06035 [Mollicutes bacterium LVI A0039]
MLLEAYTRLGLADSLEVQNALNWIKKHQVIDSNERTTWTHDSICKYGGCMKETPCYIGIGKMIKALITYAEFIDHQDEEVEALIQKGMNYILSHNMYQRLSNGKPISKHITDIMFPGAYMLTVRANQLENYCKKWFEN